MKIVEHIPLPVIYDDMMCGGGHGETQCPYFVDRPNGCAYCSLIEEQITYYDGYWADCQAPYEVLKEYHECRNSK